MLYNHDDKTLRIIFSLLLNNNIEKAEKINQIAKYITNTLKWKRAREIAETMYENCLDVLKISVWNSGVEISDIKSFTNISFTLEKTEKWLSENKDNGLEKYNKRTKKLVFLMKQSIA